jgi:hypothetical protein
MLSIRKRKIMELTGESDPIVACIRYQDMSLTVPEMAEILGTWVTTKSVWKLVDKALINGLIEKDGFVTCDRTQSLQMSFKIKE